MLARALFQTAIAHGHSPVQLADFDIEKPDMIEMIDNSIMQQEEIYAQLPVIDISKCRYCGVCAGYCPENAIQFSRYVPTVTVIVSRCYACGNCMKGCDRRGISLQRRFSGKIVSGQIGDNFFIGGKLDKHSEFGIPLLNSLLQRLNRDANVICDFGPGTSHQVSFALSGMDLAVIVLNPEPDWKVNLHSMLEMTTRAGKTAGVILNNLNGDTTFIDEVRAYCTSHSVVLLGKVHHESDSDPAERCSSSWPGSEQIAGFSVIWKNLQELIPVFPEFNLQK